ncbi:aldo/keto reductase [Catenovulum agarivorans DS-2]|uniref:Aldo/keto reductase n=1 Tax=Catenovulum agarivorans DS-2 TaxID=1328313 RepID=W7QTL4_9ALTE|nr:aldo/keto reductase family oxidoreductase [Catenovulum agarivorans]EWH08770.1 aldo/keto reductase [Catenovulum agarivorans DS-2]
MQRIQLADGLSFSQFIQGYWRLLDWDLTPVQMVNFAKQHIELGITTVDHADIYGDYECEVAFGQALKLAPDLRSQIELVTKCDIKLVSQKHPSRQIGHYDTSAAHILASVDASLQNLQTDYIDVLLLHRPDPLMSADEVADTFAELKQAGKVRHFGVSNFTPMQFDLLQSRLTDKLVTNQVEFNPMNMQCSADGTFEHLQMHKVAPMIWSCLAGGRIFGEDSPQANRVRAVLTEIGEEVGATMDQVIYAWVLKMPCNPLPIIGSGNIKRIKMAVDASSIQLTNEQWFRVWVASNGHNVP